MDFRSYVSKAAGRFGLRGQNAVAREIGISSASISQFAQGEALPSDATMIKLAELAGMPKEQALIDLNIWRSRNDPKRLNVWKNISKMIKTFCLALCFSNVITPAFCQDESHTMYIMYTNYIKIQKYQY